MKKNIIGILGLLTILSVGGELTIEKDFIRFAPYGKFALFPYSYGIISLVEEKGENSASFYFDMETKHPRRYFSQGTKAVTTPTFKKMPGNQWITSSKIPVNATDNITLTMSIKMTPFNTLDIQYDWDAPKNPGDIIAKGITLNYKTSHLKDAAVVVSGKKKLLPDKKDNGLLANNAESPDVILYPGTRMETKFALDGKYTIYYYTNPGKVTVIRIIGKDADNRLRLTIVPK